jgi:hypothetical protein
MKDDGHLSSAASLLAKLANDDENVNILSQSNRVIANSERKKRGG